MKTFVIFSKDSLNDDVWWLANTDGTLPIKGLNSQLANAF